MKSRLIHPEAVNEFREAAIFYEERQRGLGERFKRNVVEAVWRVQAEVSSGSPWIRGTSLGRVSDFPYGIVFQETNEVIQIIAIYHFSRHEDYWADRLDDLE
jgi:toxin ParE1/3/4